ncbi:MAG: NADH-quinone oxidoreductase subunit M, partial [Actinomycetota bacterium]
MQDFLDNWGITAMVFLPLVGVAIMMVLSEKEEELHKTIALVATLASSVVGTLLLFNFDYGASEVMQFARSDSWISVINADYSIGLDGMSLPLVALTLLVTPLVLIYSWNHIPEPGNAKAFLMLILVLQTGMLGTFVARDLVLFFVFFEVVLLPMYF